MSIDFNHTLVHAKDTWAAAREVGGVLGLPEPTSYGPFAVLLFDNGASLDFIEDTSEIKAQHYAFLVGEDDFDAIWSRIKEQGRQFWADPHKRNAGEVNHGDGGRGLYWEGPDGHWLEIITRSYGSGSEES
jgi:catechol 2,3-dioxygenase-like lactoylglutathione lyase family enzyme